MSEELADWLGTSPRKSTPALKLNIGEQFAGRVTDVRLIADREYGTGKPLYDSNGEEKRVMVIDLETRDGDLRALFVRGSWVRGSQSPPDALRTACLAVDRDAPQIGDVLRIRRIENDGARHRFEMRLDVAEGDR